MAFPSCGFQSATYDPINTMGFSAHPIAVGGAGASKKRSFDDVDSYEGAGADYQTRPKLSLPRSAGLVFNGEAQFHPLPADVNQAMLAQLGHNPFTGAAVGSSAGSSFVTPSSSTSSAFGHEHTSSNGSDYFGSTRPSHYPDVEPYPSTSPSSTYGILGPAPGRHTSLADADGMDVDYGSNASGSSSGVHGPQCKSIPQLCVRYNNGAGSELWATCPDCGVCSKVEADKPSSNLCYSP